METVEDEVGATTTNVETVEDGAETTTAISDGLQPDEGPGAEGLPGGEQGGTVVDNEEPDNEAKKRRGFQTRIDDLTRKNNDALGEAAYWKEKANGTDKPDTQAPTAATGEVRPQMDDFEDQESYEDALLDWNDNRKETTRQQNRASEQRKESERKFGERANTFRETHADFDQIAKGSYMQGFYAKNQHVGLAVEESENGPEIAYNLGLPENTEFLHKLSAMPQGQALVALGRFEANLSVVRHQKKPTGAPAPITPVGGGGSPLEKAPKDMTDTEWLAWRNKNKKVL